MQTLPVEVLVAIASQLGTPDRVGELTRCCPARCSHPSLHISFLAHFAKLRASCARRGSGPADALMFARRGCSLDLSLRSQWRKSEPQCKGLGILDDVCERPSNHSYGSPCSHDPRQQQSQVRQRGLSPAVSAALLPPPTTPTTYDRTPVNTSNVLARAEQSN